MPLTFSIPNPNLLIPLLLLALLPPTAQATSVRVQAAIGIGVGLGFCLCAALAGFIYLRFSKKARNERAAATAEGRLTAREAIALHDASAPKGFDIWHYDHKAHVAKVQAARRAREEEAGV
ncbi:hypothetical protein B0A50_02266 [Salinomyces thailandicus]|uniref:Uncharacterized protein n=1 Tax=Salinomyces thailandicus TaxID=706561 RepID=A0A4U0U833_9PEZI|nr:hypothetical protein B0A50_02266 [Salinomyces thailandica]